MEVYYKLKDFWCGSVQSEFVMLISHAEDLICLKWNNFILFGWKYYAGRKNKSESQIQGTKHNRTSDLFCELLFNVTMLKTMWKKNKSINGAEA